MILKLCYQNEIHRCSNPPQLLSELQALLGKTFRSELPQELSIFYIIPGLSENISLETQEDYEALLSRKVSGAVKVFIIEKQELLKEQPKIIDIELPKEVNEKKIQEEKIPEVEDKPDNQAESFVEILAEDIAPQVQKYPYFARMDTKEEEIKRIVKAALKDELPYIISQVKRAILQELKPVMPLVVEKSQVHEAVQVKNESKEAGSQYASNEIIVQDVKPEVIVQEVKPVEINKIEKPKKESNNILSKVKNFGKSIRDQFVDFPGKAKNAIEDWSQKIEGEPLVEVEEGKYPQCIIEKADELKEIFPEESRKKLLDIVNKCPRYASLTQLADYIIRNGEDQQEDKIEHVENDGNDAGENQDNNRYAC